MKKKRGLKRYYRSLSKIDFIDNLDFSNSEKSWFDYFHIHIDNTGLGNKSWKSRMQHLTALFEVAKKVESKLELYQNEYQYWVEISENDSYEDSIFIHTKNPNESEFPAKIEFDSKAEIKNQELVEYLSSKEYQIKEKILLDENDKTVTRYFLQKKSLGIKL